MSQENPMKEIVKGSAFATVAALLVPLQVWLYYRSEIESKFVVMGVIGVVQLIALIVSFSILSQVGKQVKRRD